MQEVLSSYQPRYVRRSALNNLIKIKNLLRNKIKKQIKKKEVLKKGQTELVHMTGAWKFLPAPPKILAANFGAQKDAPQNSAAKIF